MGEWQAIDLNSIVNLLKTQYPGQSFNVGVDSAHGMYYVVPGRMALDPSFTPVQTSVPLDKLLSVIGAKGFPRGIMVWTEASVTDGLFDDLDMAGFLGDGALLEGGTASVTADAAAGLMHAAEIEDLRLQIDMLETKLAEVNGSGLDASDMEMIQAEVVRLRDENRRFREQGAAGAAPSAAGADLELLQKGLADAFRNVGGDPAALPANPAGKVKAILDRLESHIRTLSTRTGASDPAAATARQAVELEWLRKETARLELERISKETARLELERLSKETARLEDEVRTLKTRVSAPDPAAATQAAEIERLRKETSRLEGDVRALRTKTAASDDTASQAAKAMQELAAIRQEREKLAQANAELTRCLAEAPKTISAATGAGAGEKLVPADEAPRVAQVSRKEFEQMVKDGKIREAADKAFRRSDLLQIALSVYEESSVPRRKYEADVESAQEEADELRRKITALENTRGEADAVRNEAQDLRRKTATLEQACGIYRGFFDDVLYDREFAQKTVDLLRKFGVAPASYTVEKFIPAREEGGKPKYMIPAAIVALVEHYEQVQFLEGRLEKIEKEFSARTDANDELHRKITRCQEEEDEISRRISEEKRELAALQSMLGDLNGADIMRLRNTIQSLINFQSGRRPAAQRSDAAGTADKMEFTISDADIGIAPGASQASGSAAGPAGAKTDDGPPAPKSLPREDDPAKGDRKRPHGRH
ncbi:MAG: hypothetical protein ABIF71_04080 [Planctomycetota bacterium]